MWKVNMLFCVAIGFGCFIWTIVRTLNAESEKRKCS